MTTKVFLAALLAALVLAPHAAAARVVSRDYELAFQNLSGSQADPVGVTSDGFIDYGGVRFTPMLGETSVQITVSDALGGAPFTTVCQDADLDLVCGEPGEPRSAGCGPITLAIAPTGGDVVVFVGIQNAVAVSIGQQSATPAPCGSNVAAGSTGTVTAAFS